MEEKDYEKIKAEYEAATDAALVAWAQPYFTGAKKPDMKDVYVIGEVTGRAASDIRELTGSDVAGFRHVLRSDVVRHVQRRHGTRGAADHSMEDLRDLGRIGYVLQNYDEIIAESKPTFGHRNKDKNYAKVITFVKRIDGHVYTAEAVTDSQKKKALHVVSMYKAKTSIKKESWEPFENNTPGQNVRNAANSSIHSIPQNDEKVNTPREKNLKNFKTYCEKHKEELRDKSKIVNPPPPSGGKGVGK